MAWGFLDPPNPCAVQRVQVQATTSQGGVVAKVVQSPERHKSVADCWCMQDVVQDELGDQVFIWDVDAQGASPDRRETLLVSSVQEDRSGER
jgi:hypothetical protein